MALLPVALLIGSLTVYIVVLKNSDLPIIPIIFATVFAALVAIFHGYGWKTLERGMIKGITLALNAALILMAIGILIGTWMLGGIVPAMIYYGLKIIAPGVFLVATLLICSIISLGTGSSWSTAGTVGLALIAVGQGLGIPVEMVAGAVISGAYFGDKMSPLSDTTNLAPAVAGTDLFTHIKHMVWTTAPGYILAIIAYSLLGLQFAGGTIDSADLNTIVSFVNANFTINPWLLLAPLIVILLVVFRVPALPAIITGAGVGGAFAMIFQGRTLSDVVNSAYDFTAIFGNQGFYDFTVLAGQAEIDTIMELLSKGGVIYMMPTVGLIIAALSFGGIMERTGMLSTIARAILARAKTTGSLITSTILSCIAMNIVAAEQYMAIVVPGRMFKKEYDRRGLHPKNLSRALEDSATLSSPLVPWNSCGAFMAGALGVNPLLYLPYAFVNLANPVVSVIYGYTGLTIAPADKTEETDTAEVMP